MDRILPVNTIQIHRLMVCIAILLLNFFFASCDVKDSDKDGITDDLDSCKSEPAHTKNGCPVRTKLNKVHFYIETSASMGGYYHKDAEYKTILSDLIIKVDKNIKPIDISFISDTIMRYPGSAEAFTAAIATTKIAETKSSEFHKIFSRIAMETDSADVSVFISDCILSFPDAEIKKNSEINKTEAPNALKNNVFSTFSDLKKRGQAASVYAFKSKFYGTYYDYQNVKTSLPGTLRPFYVWVIGAKDILNRFDQQLADISSFRPEKALHFGFNQRSVTSFKLLTQLEKNGDWTAGTNENDISNITIPKNDSVRFCLALDLDSLPSYARSIDYLQSKLRINCKGCEATFKFKDKVALDRSKLKGNRQPAIFERASHILVVSVGKMELDTAEISLALPIETDTWYQQWSVDDDRNIKIAANKTFAFENLINGVKEAYETKNSNFINININLTK